MAMRWETYNEKEGIMKKYVSYKTYLYTIGSIVLAFVLFIPKSHEDKLITAAADALPKTVMIKVAIMQPMLSIKLGDIEIFKSTQTVIQHYLGSGVFISPNGHVLTCAHLFSDGEVQSITVTDFGGTSYAAELLHTDPRRDLALCQINEFTPHYANIVDPESLKIGQEVIAIGNPLSLDFSVTHGIISYLNRAYLAPCKVTQSDAFINPGNSGGPLFNLKGELVGINSFIIPPVNAPLFTGCGFSVQAGQLIEYLNKFKDLHQALP